MSENKKPTGPTPPDGYRWVNIDEIVWPSDLKPSQLSRAEVWKAEFKLPEKEFAWLRPKVSQPDLAWLKAAALKQAKAFPDKSIEQERILFMITQAVQLYSETLMELIPEKERYSPDKMREITVQVGDRQVTLGPGESVPGEAYEHILKGGAE